MQTPEGCDFAETAVASARLWSGRRMPKDLRRAQILRSVGDVLSASRLSSLSMVDIAARLGITKGNLYYYFNDKQDILYHCHMRSVGISLDALAMLDPADSPDQQLRLLLVRHIMGIIDGGMAGVLLTDLESLSEQQRESYVKRRDEFEAGVRRLIKAGVEQGVMACADVNLAGRTILGAINWIPKWYCPSGPLSSKEIATGMADQLVRSVQPAHPLDRRPRTKAAKATPKVTAKPDARLPSL